MTYRSKKNLKRKLKKSKKKMKGGAEAIQTEWDCYDCISNKKSNWNCAVCSSKDSPSKNSPSKKSPSKKWICPQCTLENEQHVKKCIMCEEPKPGKVAQPGIEAEGPPVFFLENFAIQLRDGRQFEVKARALDTYQQIEPFNLGLLQIDGNSCWCDSALFALLLAESSVIHDALFVNEIIPYEGRPPIRFRGIDNLKDERGNALSEEKQIEYQLLARKSIRRLLIDIQYHIFFKPRQILNVKDPFRVFLGSIGLTNANFDWGKQLQCNSEEFIMKLFDLLPIRQDQHLIGIKIEGHSLVNESIDRIAHNELFQRQIDNLQRLIKSKTPVISDFRYIMKNITGRSCQGVIFSVPLDMILYSGHNSRRFGQSEIYLSDLIFKRNIIPYKADELFTDTESVDTGLIKVNAKFQSFQRIIKCPSGIFMIKIPRHSIDPSVDESNQFPVYPDKVIIPNFNSFFRPQNAPPASCNPNLFDRRYLDIPDNPLNLTCIITRSGGAKYGHYTTYFKHGDIFYLFNDNPGTITQIGDYNELIKQQNVITNGLFFIYKE